MRTNIYHGTSAEFAKNIIDNGFAINDSNWECSEPNKVYFYNNPEDCEENDALSCAFDSACITSALNNSTESHVSVLEINIDYSELEEDLSSENMRNIGSVCLEANIINELLSNGKAKISKVYNFRYYPSLRLFYLVSLKENHYLDFGKWFDPCEIEALNLIPKDCFIYDIFDKYEV